MDNDLSLKSQDIKLILLICGDSKTGKRSIVKSILKDKEFTKKQHPSFKSIFFTHEETIGNSSISIPIELRILNSGELDTELKLNKTFYNEALGAFVVNSIIDNNSFTNGEKWKDKIDLMCCLPSRFPLPIFLLINKCDIVAKEEDEEENKNLLYLQKDKIEAYSMENQFFNTFFLGKCNEDENNIINTEINDDNKISINNYNKEENIKDLIVSPSTPFKEMVKIILGFKDLRNTFIKQSGGAIDDSEFEHANQNKSKKCNIY
jgi:GTPase SAR1 family protein